MPRPIRPRARQALQGATSNEDGIVLLTITHPDMPVPIRLSSDNTVRLSDDPLIYGTRSKLIGSTIVEGNLATAAEFLFVLMSRVVPGDPEEGTPATDVNFENVSSDMVAVVRSFKTPATVHFAVVLPTDPDYVDFEWTDLRTISASYDDLSVTLSVSREDRLNYGWPNGRMTKSRFPGQHR